MGFRQATNEWLSVLLKIVGICFIVAIAFGIGISIYGNFFAGTASDIPDPPNEKKAEYSIKLSATGQEFYSDAVVNLGNGQYQIDGYYELIDSKWKKRDATLFLDEYYFGDIEVSKR